jgi:hypothetical protein
MDFGMSIGEGGVGLEGDQDLAVSGLRDAVMRNAAVRERDGARSSHAKGTSPSSRRGVDGTFESLREEAAVAVAETQSGERGGGVMATAWRRVRSFVASHPRAILLFLASAALFFVLARVLGDLGGGETFLGALIAGAVGLLLYTKVFGTPSSPH